MTKTEKRTYSRCNSTYSPKLDSLSLDLHMVLVFFVGEDCCLLRRKLYLRLGSDSVHMLHVAWRDGFRIPNNTQGLARFSEVGSIYIVLKNF